MTFEELKAIGWRNLNKAQKVLYKQLKDAKEVEGKVEEVPQPVILEEVKPVDLNSITFNEICDAMVKEIKDGTARGVILDYKARRAEMPYSDETILVSIRDSQLIRDGGDKGVVQKYIDIIKG